MKNSIGVAISLAEDKYKNNSIIQILFNNYKNHITTYTLCNLDFDWLEGYSRGLKGENGYSALSIGEKDAKCAVFDPIKRLVAFEKAQTCAECLILALQALGEDIEY